MSKKAAFLFLSIFLVGCSLPKKRVAKTSSEELIDSLTDPEQSYVTNSVSESETSLSLEGDGISAFLKQDLVGIEAERWPNYGDDIQDGCIYNDTLFSFCSDGLCRVYDINNNNLICESQLSSYNGFIPHSNAVCFGKKYIESDPFPLLYTNVYNNYPSNKDSYGMCFVYRIIQAEQLAFELIQVIKIGFTNDLDLWFDNSNNSSPYGNFLPRDNSLWVYLNIFGSNKTRFFRFNLPLFATGLTEIDYVELGQADIEEQFDTELFSYIQGGTADSGYIYALSGFGNDSFPPFLRSINLKTKEVFSLDLSLIIGPREPEFIDIYNGSLIVGTNHGLFCKLF